MKHIKKDSIDVMFNVGNANHQTLNKLVFKGELRPRSTADKQMTDEFKYNKRKMLVFASNGRVISFVSLESFNGGLWDFFGGNNSEMPRLSRRYAESLERKIKAFTDNEIKQIAFGIASIRNHVGWNTSSGNYKLNWFSNPTLRHLQNNDNLNELFDIWLNNDKLHFENLDRFINQYAKNNRYNAGRNVSSFTRIYLKSDAYNHNVRPKNLIKFDVAFGEMLHQCVKTDEIRSFWSFSKFELWNNESKLIHVKQLNGFVTSEWHGENLITCGQCNYDKLSDEMHNLDDAKNYIEKHGVIYGGQTSCCKNCFTDNLYNLSEYAIGSHRRSDNPTLKFWSHNRRNNKFTTSRNEPNSVCYGWELEVEMRENPTYTKNVIAWSIGKESNGYCFTKYDGSLRDGFEIVSQPATFNAIQNMDLKNIVFKHRKDLKGFYTSTAGMHVHINRSSFTDLQLYKFVLMINENEKLTKSISQRRRDTEFERWAVLDGGFANKCKKDSADKIKSMKSGQTMRPIDKKYQADITTGGTRYLAVNLQNDATIEVRIFKSNLDEVAFRKNIEFVDAMFWFCKESRIGDLNVENFLKFVKRNQKSYSNLITFLGRTSTMNSLLQ